MLAISRSKVKPKQLAPARLRVSLWRAWLLSLTPLLVCALLVPYNGSSQAAIRSTYRPQPPPALNSFNVGWTALLNTTATGNTIEKTGGTQSTEDGKARSTNLLASGDGFVEFQFTVPGAAVSVGLNSGRQAFYTFDMEFALAAVGSLNVVEVRENGDFRIDTSYTAADVFRIEVSGAQVLYKKNGVTFFTKANPTLIYPYHADALLFDLGSRVANATMSTTAGVAGPLPPSNFIALSVTANQINLAWTDNATDETGFILERAATPPATSPSNWVLILTSGTNVTSYNDQGVSPATIYHYRLRAFNANGESVDRQISNLQTPATAPSPSPTPTPSPSPSPTPTPSPSPSPTPTSSPSPTPIHYDVVWTGRVNATANGSTIEKTGGQADNEDARARSTNQISSGDGFVEFRIDSTGKALNIGLNSGSQAMVRADMEFAFSAIGGLNVVEIRESGTFKGDASYTTSDVFRIEIAGAAVNYQKNGSTFFTTTAPTLAYPYHADVTMISSGARAANVTMSTQAGQLGPLPPSNLVAVPVSSAQINVSWTDDSMDESGFLLERAQILSGGGLGNWVNVVTTAPNVTSYGDAGLIPATTYAYRLRSFNSNGESLIVQAANVTTLAGSPSPTPTPYAVEWTGLVNTTATGSTVEKTGGGANNDDARARSVNTIYSYSGGGYIEFQLTAPGLITVGLNSGAQATTRPDIEFALSTVGVLNIIEVREAGAYKGETSYSAADVFRIEIVHNQVLYKKNGATFYTNSNPALVYPFHGDAVLVTSGVRAANATMSTPAPTPILLVDQNHPTHAVALDSVMLMSGSFPLTNALNFSADHHTRVILFVANFELLPGEDFHTVVVPQLMNQQGTVFNLPVEYVGKVDGFDWLTSVVVRLDEQVTNVGDLNISLMLRGVSTNTALITTKP